MVHPETGIEQRQAGLLQIIQVLKKEIQGIGQLVTSTQLPREVLLRFRVSSIDQLNH